jgi:hypothetical protein
LSKYSTISTPTGHAKDPVSLWTEASARCKAGVKKLVLKGTGEARCKPPRRQAWLRDNMVSPNEAGFNLRERPPLSRILHKGLPPTGQRPNLDVVGCLKDYRDWLYFETSPRVIAGHLAYPAIGRDTAMSGMGCKGNRHLNYLGESISVNVGGSYQAAKVSSPPILDRSVGATIVCAEQRVAQEGSSPSDARMRSVVSKSGGNSSLAGKSGRFGEA